MLTVLIGDVMATARVLRAVDAKAAPQLLDRMLAEAHAAHLYRKRTGRAHPVWGNGSLMARAGAFGPGFDLPMSDARHLACMALVIERLAARLAGREAAPSAASPRRVIFGHRQESAAWARRG